MKRILSIGIMAVVFLLVSVSFSPVVNAKNKQILKNNYDFDFIEQISSRNDKIKNLKDRDGWFPGFIIILIVLSLAEFAIDIEDKLPFLSTILQVILGLSFIPLLFGIIMFNFWLNWNSG